MLMPPSITTANDLGDDMEVHLLLPEERNQILGLQRVRVRGNDFARPRQFAECILSDPTPFYGTDSKPT